MSEVDAAVPNPNPEPSGPGAVRLPEARVEALFRERRSTRVFDGRPVPDEALRSVLEAARWAPSSRNEQPWRFVHATTPGARAALLEGLVEPNRQWAQHAPVLFYLFVRPRTSDGLPNPYAEFDAGAAWVSLALQAHLLGLSAHAMGGVERARMSEITGLDPEEYRPVAAIALGYPAPGESVPPAFRESERPSERVPLAEISRPYASLDRTGAAPAG